MSLTSWENVLVYKLIKDQLNIFLILIDPAALMLSPALSSTDHALLWR